MKCMIRSSLLQFLKAFVTLNSVYYLHSSKERDLTLLSLLPYPSYLFYPYMFSWEWNLYACSLHMTVIYWSIKLTLLKHAPWFPAKITCIVTLNLPAASKHWLRHLYSFADFALFHISHWKPFFNMALNASLSLVHCKVMDWINHKDCIYHLYSLFVPEWTVFIRRVHRS